jgi:exodeoxyribonuclease VII large subunit
MLPGPLEDGMLVQIVCTPRLHPQFNFSLQLQSITPKGEGALARAMELLQKKLESEGLFSTERKRPIVFAPERIALITSAESAAYADFVKITAVRWPRMSIDLYSTLVQGQEAASQIVSAVEKANQQTTEYDAIVLIRGGGSAEDLSVFNDERIVRSIATSRTPTLVAIGHEVDESLSELASDMRASTPSNAAELLTPDRLEEYATLKSRNEHFGSILGRITDDARARCREYAQYLTSKMEQLVAVERLKVTSIRERFMLLDPKEVLKRGYSLIRKSGKVVSSTLQLSKGDEVAILLQDGETKAIIT